MAKKIKRKKSKILIYLIVFFVNIIAIIGIKIAAKTLVITSKVYLNETGLEQMQHRSGYANALARREKQYYIDNIESFKTSDDLITRTYSNSEKSTRVIMIVVLLIILPAVCITILDETCDIITLKKNRKRRKII